MNDIINSFFLHAVHKEDMLTIKTYINSGADINARYDEGLTALMIASGRGNEKILDLLLQNGADVNLKSNDGATALFFASMNGHTNIVYTLIKNGADVNIKTNNGLTPLMIASLKGHKDAVSILIDNGADIESRGNNNMTAAMLADELGYSDIKELLPEKNKSNSSKKIICQNCGIKIDINSKFCSFCGKKVENPIKDKFCKEGIDENFTVGDKDFWFNRGLGFIDLNDLRRALDAFKKAIELDESFADAWYQIGLIYGSTYHYKEAVDALKNAARLKPGFSKALKMLGLTCESLMMYKDAESSYRSYLELNKDDKEIWDRLGYVYKAQGRIIAAIRAFAKGPKD